MIKQVSRKNEQVMTQLVCDVDGVEVTYTQLLDSFAYHMRVMNDVSYDDALKAVDQLVQVMEHQSYDHGQEWRRTSIEPQPKDERYRIDHEFIVHFRMKDSY